MERGSTEGNTHLQGYCELRCSTVRAAVMRLRKDCDLGDSGAKEKYSVSIRALAGEGLHTQIGMIGYCLKDKMQSWFKTKMAGISDDKIKRGEELYIRLGKSLKNRGV